MNRPARARRRVSRCRASRARAVLGAALRESCVNRHGSAVDTHRSHAPAGNADQRSDALLKRNVGFHIWTANIQAAENASHVPSIKNVDYVALTRIAVPLQRNIDIGAAPAAFAVPLMLDQLPEREFALYGLGAATRWFSTRPWTLPRADIWTYVRDDGPFGGRPPPAALYVSKEAVRSPG